ncbi:hypothetical protein HN51_043411 [Arachis hypogaea]
MVQRLFLVLAREPKRTRLLPTVLDPRPGILPLSNRNQPPLYCARTVERPPASYFRTVHRYRFILRTWSNFTTPRGLVRSQSCLVGLYWTKQRKESARPANKDHRILNEWKQATLLIKVRLLSKASCRSANARPYSSLAPQYEPHTEQRPFNMMRRRGIRGILLNRRNIPIMSMPIESMLLAVNSNFLVFSVSSDDMMGQSFASLVSTVAAAESAIGPISSGKPVNAILLPDSWSRFDLGLVRKRWFKLSLSGGAEFAKRFRCTLQNVQYSSELELFGGKLDRKPGIDRLTRSQGKGVYVGRSDGVPE